MLTAILAGTAERVRYVRCSGRASPTPWDVGAATVHTDMAVEDRFRETPASQSHREALHCSRDPSVPFGPEAHRCGCQNEPQRAVFRKGGAMRDRDCWGDD